MESGSSLPSVARLEEVMEEGGRAIKNGLWKEALQLFNAAIQLKPHYMDAWLGKAQALRGAGDLQGAADTYRKSLEVDPANKSAWIGLIETLHEWGKYRQEIEACDCLLRLSPRFDDALLNKGVALHRLGKLDAALECFTQVADRRPENIAALNDKGAVLLRLGRIEEALEAFDSALVIEPQHEEVQKNRCLLLIRLGRYSEAVRAAEEMLSVREEGWLWMLKGLSHAELREVPLALESLERAKELDPGLDGLEDALDKIRRLKELTTVAEEKQTSEVEQSAIEDDGLTEESAKVAPQGIAAALNNIGYPTESLRIWQESIDKDSYEDWLGLGRALMAGGENRSAERCLAESARRRNQDGEEQRISMEELPLIWREVDGHISNGRIDEAIELLTRVLEHRKDLEHAWELLGILRALSGQWVSSEAALQQASEIQPDCATVWSNLGAVQACQCKLNESSNAFRTALIIDPNNLEALNNLGIVESRRGNDHEARQLLRRAIEIEDRPQTRLALASVLEKLNRWREASGCYMKILVSEPGNSTAMAGIARARGHVGAQKLSRIRKSVERLMDIPGIGPARARVLAKAGYGSAKEIAKAPTHNISKLPSLNKRIAVEMKKGARQLLKKRKARKPSGR